MGWVGHTPTSHNPRYLLKMIGYGISNSGISVYAIRNIQYRPICDICHGLVHSESIGLSKAEVECIHTKSQKFEERLDQHQVRSK